MLSPSISLDPYPAPAHRSYTLANDISAMQVLPFEDSGPRLGPVLKLPKGAKVETCGGGFNKTTLKVAYEGQYYFVFRQELGLVEQSAFAAS